MVDPKLLWVPAEGSAAEARDFASFADEFCIELPASFSGFALHGGCGQRKSVGCISNE